MQSSTILQNIAYGPLNAPYPAQQENSHGSFSIAIENRPLIVGFPWFPLKHGGFSIVMWTFTRGIERLTTHGIPWPSIFITLDTAISKSSCVTCCRRSRRANMPALRFDCAEAMIWYPSPSPRVQLKLEVSEAPINSIVLRCSLVI